MHSKNNHSQKSETKGNVRGRTISIYIPDSNPKSVKICDIKDSIVKAFFIPRNKLGDALKREELQQPGVYFLVGEKNEVGKPKIYIGEAETLIERIKQHNNGKNDEDFWNSVICFISEKKNINKAHIKYLENLAYDRAKEAKKCELENTNTPTRSNLTEQEIDFALSFFDDLKLLIATLGYPIFEESKKEDSSRIFVIDKKVDKRNIIAKGEYAEDGFVVFKDSQASNTESKGARPWITNIRKKLTETGILEEKGDSFVFTEDYTFGSPSAAAAVIIGHEANGWKEWKDKNKKTLDERYRKTTMPS